MKEVLFYQFQEMLQKAAEKDSGDKGMKHFEAFYSLLICKDGTFTMDLAEVDKTRTS